MAATVLGRLASTIIAQQLDARMRAHSTGRGDAMRGQHRFGGLLWQLDFRLLWAGQSVSETGNAVALVAMPLLTVTVLHASTFVMGVLIAAEWVPWLVIGLPAGAWVDRLPGPAGHGRLCALSAAPLLTRPIRERRDFPARPTASNPDHAQA